MQGPDVLERRVKLRDMFPALLNPQLVDGIQGEMFLLTYQIYCITASLYVVRKKGPTSWRLHKHFSILLDLIEFSQQATTLD